MAVIHLNVAPPSIVPILPASQPASQPAPQPARLPRRGTSTRRKAKRPAPPQTPEALFSAQGHAFISDVLVARAARWKADDLAPVYFYGRDSEPLWGEDAVRRVSGTTLHIASKWVLCEGLSMDLERILRLLTLPWENRDKTADGHSAPEWHAALAGTLWRIGQHYREFVRRKGEAGAQELVQVLMSMLWR
jgi:hypothetical protein